jgi:hypothetical protein
MTTGALSTAARATSTETPSEHHPCASGSETWIERPAFQAKQRRNLREETRQVVDTVAAGAAP